MKLSHIFYLLALSPLGFTACDNVDEADRFEGPIQMEEILKNTRKNVLIEDFTGQRCVNCPKAADVIHTLQSTYGKDRVIAVAIHGGTFGVNEETSKLGLANETGRQYYEHWNIKSQPKGMIDRLGGGIDFEQWQGLTVQRLVNSLSEQPLKVDLKVENLTYDAATRNLSIDVNVEGKTNVAGNLQVWLTESNLVRMQLLPGGGSDKNYVHNHVFRASVNDPYGDGMKVATDERQKASYTYQLKENWTPENMAVVVFFYNEEDGVMQVIEEPIQKQDQ